MEKTNHETAYVLYDKDAPEGRQIAMLAWTQSELEGTKSKLKNYEIWTWEHRPDNGTIRTLIYKTP